MGKLSRILQAERAPPKTSVWVGGYDKRSEDPQPTRQISILISPTFRRFYVLDEEVEQYMEVQNLLKKEGFNEKIIQEFPNYFVFAQNKTHEQYWTLMTAATSSRVLSQIHPTERGAPISRLEQGIGDFLKHPYNNYFLTYPEVAERVREICRNVERTKHEKYRTRLVFSNRL
jgi:hypothetical protein